MRNIIKEKSDDFKRVVPEVLFAFLGTYGVSYVANLAGYSNASYSVFTVMLLIFIQRALSWAHRDLDTLTQSGLRKRRVIFSALLGFCFSVSMIMGWQLQKNGMTESGFYGKGMILIRSLCLTFAVFPLCSGFFKLIEKIPVWKKDRPQARFRERSVFGVCAVLIFLCLIPVWLAYYPIVMSYDFHRQVNEAANGLIWFTVYQPIVHTLVIWVFYQLGTALGSLQTGFACMAIFQMILYSLVTAYACSFIYRVVKKIYPVVICAAFFALFPFNTILVVCTTKDTLFSILFLLFFLLLLERAFYSDGKKQIVMDVLLVLEGCLMIQFRSNAIYAVAVFAVFLVILARKKEKLEILLLCVLVVAGGRGLQAAAVQAIRGAQATPPAIEMYSVPVMQFARVAYYHGDELDEETAAIMETYFDRESWGEYYAPISDGMKYNAKDSAFCEDTLQFIKDWWTLFKKYPNEFIDAFLELTRGYWFWDDTSWAEYLGYGLEERMGSLLTYTSSQIGDGDSIEHETKFAWLEERLEDMVSANCFYNWPVVSQLFKCAFYAWGVVLTVLAALYLKERQQLVLGLLPLLYFMTMLLGPVAQIRYLYPNMLTLPVMVAILWIPTQKNGNLFKNCLHFGKKSANVNKVN